MPWLSLIESLLERFRERHPELASLQDITNVNESLFVTQFAGEFDGGEREARRVYKTAIRLRDKAILVWMNLRDVLSPYYRQTLFNNLPTELPECFLSQQDQIPGYEGLFESLDFIECDHARSILGPAAYFVDLLRFVKRNITSQIDNASEHNDCQLSTRRPDLDRIRLDATNTSELIPYIDLVIEVLEAFLQTADAQDIDPYELLRTVTFPIELPFHRPLSEIYAYLQQLKTSLYQVHQTFKQPLLANSLDRRSQTISIQAFLELSPETFQLIIQTLGQTADIVARYGNVPLSGRQGLENVEVLLAQTQLTRAQLNELLYQDLDRDEVNAGLSQLFFINNVEDGQGYLTLEVDESDPGNPYERLVNLSPAKLDRIYRFVKLAQHWDGAYTELDRALRSLTSPYLPERALSFDGINDAVSIRQFTQLQATDLTVEAWIHPAQTGKQVILSKGDEAAPQLHFVVWLNSSDQLVLSMRLTTGEIEEVVSNRTVTVDTFTHVAVTLQNTTVSLYLNGQLDNTQNLSGGTEPVGTDLYIGRGLVGSEAFTGLIKEVRIWSTALGQAQISRDRYQRFTGKEKFLLGYWPLVETDTGQLTDLTPHQNHGTLGGAQLVTEPRWVHRDLVLAPLPRANNGNGFEFNGSDQYLAGTGLTYTANGGLTIEANLRLAPESPRAEQQWPILFVGDRLTSTLDFGLWVNSARQVVCQVGDTQHVSSSTMPLQTLTHVAIVLRGATLTFYIDAIQAGAAISLSAAPTIELDQANLLLGRNLAADYFEGALQEVRIWMGERTEEQLDRFRYRSVPGNAAGLIGYWPLDKIENGQAVDRSVGGHALYLGGLPEDYRPPAVAIAQIRPPRPMTALGIDGTVLEFVGENDVITITNPNNHGLGQFEQLTLEFWFRPAETNLRSNRHQILLSQGDAEAGLTIYLLGQKLYVVAWCADYDDIGIPEKIQRTVLVANGTTLASDQWYHLAVVNDESRTLDAIAFEAYLHHGTDVETLSVDSTTWSPEIANLGTGFRLSPVGAAYLGGIGQIGFARFHDLLLLDNNNQHQYYFAGADGRPAPMATGQNPG